MFSARSHVRNLILPPSIIAKTWGRRSLSGTCSRWAGIPRLSKAQLGSSYPVADQLIATGVWDVAYSKTEVDPSKEAQISDEGEANVGEGEESQAATASESGKARAGSGGTKKSKMPKTKKPKEFTGDKSRVNIVSDQLCDHILRYIGPSLERHKRCDLIDIYPGAGVWSQKLHDFLKPRSHILLEPDEDLYRPFLEPLLENPGTRLVPKSGIVWRDLNSILTPEFLPHQKPIEESTTSPPRNDTLLVTANIAFHPRKRFRTFESLALLVFHQLLGSIRTSSLFQKYGTVRMLIWSRHDDTASLIPRNMQRRRRTSIEGELSCEWIREVCGRDGPNANWYVRDSATEVYSTLNALHRMREAKMRIPRIRATEALRKEKYFGVRLPKRALPGKFPPEFKRPFMDVLSELENRHEQKVFTLDSEDFIAMKKYQWRQTAEKKRYEKMHKMLKSLDRLTAMHKAAEEPEPEEPEEPEPEGLELEVKEVKAKAAENENEKNDNSESKKGKIKRGRGRPRKHKTPELENQEPETQQPSTPKNEKENKNDGGESEKGKSKRGRPRKHKTPEPETQEPEAQEPETQQPSTPKNEKENKNDGGENEEGKPKRVRNNGTKETEIPKPSTPENRARLLAEWHDNMRPQVKSFAQEFLTYRDNLHYARQQPPLLHWDRRMYESLVVQPEEFLPNIECCLLDVQPSTDINPLLRQMGPNSNRGGDILDLLIAIMMAQSTVPLPHMLDCVWPGAAEFIMPRWKSIRDLKSGQGVPDYYKDVHDAGSGGRNIGGDGGSRYQRQQQKLLEMTPRMLNARQWGELIELWMQWPFRPELHELIARNQDTEDPHGFAGDGADAFQV